MDTVTPLRALGYAVLPSPRRVELEGSKVTLAAGCDVRGSAGELAGRQVAETLRQRGIHVGPSAAAVPIIISVVSGAVTSGCGDGRDDQAYRLDISADRIEITGNAPAGAFHGAQTLIQLIESAPGPRPDLPVGVITDWPDHELRFVHWDTKHHQDRLQTLKGFLDELARFKINAVSFELEDKFEYPSHPVIGAPGAFTTDQLIELTRYSLERHIEIVPTVQSPAHLAYVLKHEQFAHLRCDGSNYQICMDEPEARALLFSMYDDLCKATPGVRFFHVSTDEVYYAGICEKFRRPYNAVNRSLTLVDYINAAHAFLKDRGRRVLTWVEFPILTEHLHLLPSDMIDGVIGGDREFIDEENRLGIRQLIYASMQGMELLFPSYFPETGPGGKRSPDRLAAAFAGMHSAKSLRARPIGTFAAAWDDSGLHNETFWLGWAQMAQCGWNSGRIHLEQSIADFMDVFHGPTHDGMAKIYQEMHRAARFYEAAWESRPSSVRGPAYGSSKGKRLVGRTDLTLIPPILPKLADLAVNGGFRERHQQILEDLPKRLLENRKLAAALLHNLTRVRRNHYNLEVYLSLVRLMRHQLVLLESLAGAEADFERASAAHRQGDNAAAVDHLAIAAERIAHVIADLHGVYEALKATWEKSRRPRNAQADGREFLHVMDDVKDHFADRRPDLSYLIAPEESIKLPEYLESLNQLIGQYRTAHRVQDAAATDHEPPPLE